MELEGQPTVPNEHRGCKNNNCERGCLSFAPPPQHRADPYCPPCPPWGRGAQRDPADTELNDLSTVASAGPPRLCAEGASSRPRPSLQPIRPTATARHRPPPAPPSPGGGAEGAPAETPPPPPASQSARAGPGRAWVHPTRSHVTPEGGGGHGGRRRPAATCRCGVATSSVALVRVCPGSRPGTGAPAAAVLGQRGPWGGVLAAAGHA